MKYEICILTLGILEIFVDSGFSIQIALVASLGFGIVNFLFALPAFYTIDTFGRRNLLLTTFPVSLIDDFFLVLTQNKDDTLADLLVAFFSFCS